MEIDVVPLGGQRHYIFSGIVHHLFNEDSFKKRKKKRNKPEKVLEKKAIQHVAGIVLSPGLSTPSSSGILGKLMFQRLNLYLFDQKSEKRAHGATVDSKPVHLSPEH